GLIFVAQVNLCWRIYLELDAALDSLKASSANIITYLNSGNKIVISFLSISFLYFNWVSQDRVQSYVEQLQNSICLPKAGNSRRNIIIMLIYMVCSSFLCLAALWWYFITFEADIFNFQLLFENSMSHYLFKPVLPQWVADKAWLKLFCQFYIIFTEFHYVVYVHLSDMSILTNSYFGYLISKEFVDVICQDKNLTAQEFLRFYQSFKKVQHCRNKYYSLFTVVTFFCTVLYYSLQSREMIDSTGMTGQEMDLATRICLWVYICDAVVYYALSTKNCIKCKKIRKIFKGKLLMEFPLYQLRLVLEDIQNGIHCVGYSRLLIFTPGMVGMMVQNVMTFSIIRIQSEHQ
ncbi:unnamed protein product, partial [Allacma fusca]